MSFIAIFIAVLLERFFDYSHLRKWKWFGTYQKKIAQKLVGQSSYVLFAAIIAPFVVAALALQFFFSGFLFGFLKLFISIAVILYCFGPRNLWADIFACLIDITNGDAKALAEKLKFAFNIVPNNGPDSMHRELTSHIFIEANRRIFAVMFWYGVLGLVGVVLYRVITVMVEETDKEHFDVKVAQMARQAEGYMEWLAVRALTLLFALGGNFSKVFSAWRQDAARSVESNDAMLVDCGRAALNAYTDKELPTDGTLEKEQISLLDRSFIIMLVVLAVLVYWIP